MYTILFWLLVAFVLATLAQRIALLFRLKQQAPALYASLGITTAIGWNFFLFGLVFGKTSKNIDSKTKLQARIMLSTWAAEFVIIAAWVILLFIEYGSLR